MQALILDASDFLAGMKDARTAMLEAAKAADVLAENIVKVDSVFDDLTASSRAASAGVNDFRNAAAGAAGADSQLVSSLNDLRTAVAENTAALSLMAGRLNDMRDSMATAALATSALSGSLKGLAVANLANQATQAGNGFRLLGTGIRLTGTAIHWIVAGTAELLAVLIPATVAAGAWAAVWLQGATNVAQHINAVYTASEALANAGAKTAGQVLGLGDALQKAQNAANPDVYQALGGAINLVKESAGGLAGVGLQMGRIFDTFMGKLVFDFSAAGKAGQTLHSLLSGMVPDLVHIGQLFGNLGAALASFAAQMPGLAPVLLGLLAALAGIAKDILQFSQSLTIAHVSVLTFLMGMEEFARWGGLLVGIMGRLGFATTALEGNFSSIGGFFQRFGSVALNLVRAPILLLSQGIATVGHWLSFLPGVLGRAGSAMEVFGTEVGLAGAAMTAFGAVLILAAAVTLGILIDKIVTAQKSWQQYDASLDKAVASSKNGYAAIAAAATGIADLSNKMNVLNSATLHFGSLTVTATKNSAAMGDASNAATQQIAHFGQVITNVNTGASQIAKALGISVPAAMQLAASAGVNLTNKVQTQSGAWNALGEKVMNAAAGYKAMGVAGGMLGSDMLAVAIQTGEAGTQMQKVSQAWDQFLQDITSGTGDLAGFETSMQNIGSVATTVRGKLATATQNMNLNTQQFAQALTHYTGVGAAAWQNFDQVLGTTAPQVADFLRVALSEGVLGQGTTAANNFSTAILGMAKQMVPLASRSKAAQAELLAFVHQADPGITTFAQLKKAVDQSGVSIAHTGDVINQATVKMGNMAQVAQNLGDVMNNDVAQAISNAALKATGFYTDTNNLTQALAHNGTYGGHTASYWAHQTAQAYQQAASEAQNATGKVGGLTSAWSRVPRNVTTTYTVNEILGHSLGGNTGVGILKHPAPAVASPSVTTIHVHGDVVTDQSKARVMQAALNRKTIRNGSTQLFIAGRNH